MSMCWPPHPGTTLIDGMGAFEQDGSVWAGEQVFRAHRYVVATGAEPRLPLIAGRLWRRLRRRVTGVGMVVDKFQPDHWDYIGAAICLIGVAVIMYAPRA
jgi:small multidrug resistance family-3 protein